MRHITSSCEVGAADHNPEWEGIMTHIKVMINGARLPPLPDRTHGDQHQGSPCVRPCTLKALRCTAFPARPYHLGRWSAVCRVAMNKSPSKVAVERAVVVLFTSGDDLDSGAKLLKSRT